MPSDDDDARRSGGNVENPYGHDNPLADFWGRLWKLPKHDDERENDENGSRPPAYLQRPRPP
jgi:hypothetical protein